MAVAAIGLLLFLSTFVSFALNFGKFDHFEDNARSNFLRAIGGMVLLIAGGACMGVGRGGLAGSGLLLDPEQAKRDLEPYARIGGGLTDAAFSEMPTVREAIADLAGAEPPEVIKVRCRECKALNDQHDRFCGQCGAKML
jgi:hypothetical protein